LEQSFAARVPLPMATNAFGLESRHQCSLQWSHLHCLCITNSNWGIYIAPSPSRPRTHYKTSQPILWCPRTESNRCVFI